MPGPISGGSSGASDSAAGEQLLSTTTVDLNNGDAQTLYTVPVGKRLLVTRYVMRDFSGSMSSGDTSTVSLGGGTSFAATFNVGSATTSSLFVIDFRPSAVTSQTPRAAGAGIAALVDTPAGLPRTVVIDLFGYLFDA